MTTHYDLLLVRNHFVESMCWLHLVSESVTPTMQVSPELVKVSLWPLFCPQKKKEGVREKERERRKKERKSGFLILYFCLELNGKGIGNK